MTGKPSTPNDDLAEQIVDELLAKDIIKDHRAAMVKSKLMNGGCTASDWRIWAEDFAKPEGDDAEATP